MTYGICAQCNTYQDMRTVPLTTKTAGYKCTQCSHVQHPNMKPATEARYWGSDEPASVPA